jgi:hypothetical protein
VLGLVQHLSESRDSLIAASLGLGIDATIHYAELQPRAAGRPIGQPPSSGRCADRDTHPLHHQRAAAGLPGVRSRASFRATSGCSPASPGISLIANLALLPALLATTKIITCGIWSVSGSTSRRTIPLFAKASSLAARVVVLMGEVRRFDPAPTSSVRAASNEMYVL